MSQTKLNETFRDVVGKSPEGRQLAYHLREMTDEQLRDTLEVVRTARPVRIGSKIVVRPSTERKIESLRNTLIGEGKLTNEAFNEIVNKLKLPTTKYENADNFITEKEGRALIRAMNSEAEIGLVERDAKVNEAITRNPEIKAVLDEYGKRMTKEGEPFLEKKAADLRWQDLVLRDMRFLTERLQIRTGQRFYDVYFAANRQHLANDTYMEGVYERLTKSTPGYSKLVNDKESMQRIRDYIAAKQPDTKVQSPANITPEEVKLAKAYEKEFLALQPDFKYQRFVHIYNMADGNTSKMMEHYADAPVDSLRRGVNIYEAKGATALKEYLDTQDWGIIGSGYEPHYVVSPQLAMRKMRGALPTRRFEPRSGVEFYPEDITIDRAAKRYVHQLLNFNLQPYIKRIESLYAESLKEGKFGQPGRVNQMLTGWANEVLGYKDRSFLGELAMKVASQAYVVVFGTSIDLPFRNVFQNLAYSTHKQDFINPTNRKLTEYERQWYDTYTAQMSAIKRHHLLSEERGLPGFRKVNQLALRLNLYGLSDNYANRRPAFWATLNRAERALKQYQKDGDIRKFINSSGMTEMTLTQQKQVLENLMLDKVNYEMVGETSGQEAALLEIANEVTNNIHFLYDRSQRAPIEHAEGGRLIGSLMVFGRSAGQRTLIQLGHLNPQSWASSSQKKAAMTVLTSMLLGSLAAGWLFKKATGKEKEPYNPLNLLQWSPGGLSLGAIQQLGEVAGLLFMTMSGSDWAKGQLPTAITRSGDTFVPFYKATIRLIEAAGDKKYIDRQMMRELRSIIERQRYKPNKNYYEAERSWEWRIKHALFGTEPED